MHARHTGISFSGTAECRAPSTRTTNRASRRRTGDTLSDVLFVSHDATRTGAPIVLLHLLRWLRANTDIDPTVLLTGDGPLATEFEAVGATVMLPPTTSPLARAL